MIAADYGQAKILEYLISKGLEASLLDSPDKHGITPLLAAVFEGHTECVKILINAVSQRNIFTNKAHEIYLRVGYYHIIVINWSWNVINFSLSFDFWDMFAEVFLTFGNLFQKIYFFTDPRWIRGISGHYYDGLKFACMDFSSQQQKRRKALCIQTDLFLSFLITQLSFPINGRVCQWLIRQLANSLASCNAC